MMTRWWIRGAIGAVAVLLFAFAAREFPALAVFVAVVVALCAVAHFIMRARGMRSLDPELEREKNERFLRDAGTPPSG